MGVFFKFSQLSLLKGLQNFLILEVYHQNTNFAKTGETAQTVTLTVLGTAVMAKACKGAGPVSKLHLQSLFTSQCLYSESVMGQLTLTFL